MTIWPFPSQHCLAAGALSEVYLDRTQTGRGQGGLPTQEEILLSFLFSMGAGTGKI